MKCITTTSFMLNINGDMVGFFKGRRGLRQGDPMSFYRFTLVMEVVHLIIQRRIVNSNVFKFHWKCEKLSLVQMCFADDFLLFCKGELAFVSILKDALEEFGGISGLIPNVRKSTLLFYNVPSNVQGAIVQSMGFHVGELPICYLGVPLLSKRLYIQDCKVLVDKIRVNVMDWKNKSLSFAGRSQLISSVLNSMQFYWASLFIIPVQVFDDIEKLVKGFLWCKGAL